MHKSLGEFDSQLHVYDKGHPDVHPVYREIRRLLDLYSEQRPRVAVGEIHIFDWKEWASYYGTELDEIHLPFNFQMLGVKWQARAVRKIVDSLEAVLPEGAWPNYVMGNHDESRLGSRIGPEAAPLAAMLLLTLRGTPTLYYGDEIGMTGIDIPPEKQQDPWGVRVPGLGRDGCRTPMQWDDSPNAGFSQASRETWLPLSGDYPQVNVLRQLNQPDSRLIFTASCWLCGNRPRRCKWETTGLWIRLRLVVSHTCAHWMVSRASWSRSISPLGKQSWSIPISPLAKWSFRPTWTAANPRNWQI